jgi:hypothetical protein
MNRIGGNRELEATHRALWASGDYPAVAAELIPELGRNCSGRVASEPETACSMSLRDRVTPPSRRPRPEPLSPQAISRQSCSRAGRRIAEARGVEVEWVEADAEAMPFADNGFDVVMSRSE